MFCGKCGAQVQDGMKFCPKCGAANTFNNVKDQAQQAWTENAKTDGEFRVVNNVGLRAGIIIASLLVIIMTLHIFFHLYYFDWCSNLIIIQIFLGGLIIGAISTISFAIKIKTMYLSEYITKFVINIIVSIMVLVSFLVGSSNGKMLPVIVVVANILVFISFLSLTRNKKSTDKNTFLITTIVCFMIVLLLRLLHFTVDHYDDPFGYRGIFFIGYENELYFFWRAMILNSELCFWRAMTLNALIDVLFALSISNKPDKEYASLKEPTGAHIRVRSIPFMILMSILTLGVYTLIWEWRIMESIRKVEGRNTNVLGEWFLVIFFPYRWYWLYTRAKKLQVISTNNHVNTTGGGGLYIFFDITLLYVVDLAMIQSNLNQLAVVMGKKEFVYGTEYVEKEPTVIVQNQTPVSSISNADELKKYKELLDMGAITQEEFDAKKMQLLS